MQLQKKREITTIGLLALVAIEAMALIISVITYRIPLTLEQLFFLSDAMFVINIASILGLLFVLISINSILGHIEETSS